MPNEIQGRNGGTLRPQKAGEPAPPGAGRPKNLFKQAIHDIAESEVLSVQLSGRLVEGGVVTSKRVTVEVEMPSVQAVVYRMYKKAQAGDVAAAKWLSETGYGKTINLDAAGDGATGGGFAVIMLPPNGR